MNWTEMFGYLGAIFTLTTFSMKTMIRLRMVGIVANFVFITYGVLGHVYPVLLLHLTLLPLNLFRLQQLQRLTGQIRSATAGGTSMEWLKPFSHSRKYRTGEVLFRLGDHAGEILFVLSGTFRAVEANVPLEKGGVIGELGLVAKDHKRTQTVVCEQDGVVLLLTYDEARQMYFQNPSFGFFLLELVAERLMRDASRGSTPKGQQAIADPVASAPVAA